MTYIDILNALIPDLVFTKISENDRMTMQKGLLGLFNNYIVMRIKNKKGETVDTKMFKASPYTSLVKHRIAFKDKKKLKEMIEKEDPRYTQKHLLDPYSYFSDD